MSTAKKFFPNENVKGDKKQDLKSSTPSNPSAESSAQDKAQIEIFKKLIAEKMKDPALAKKAALILSQMLEKNSGK